MIVWLASYPRSGNTFFRVILNKVFNIKTYSIYDDKSDIGADKSTKEVVGHEFLPEGFEIEHARAEDKQYFIKTHELKDSRVADGDLVVYLVRDGRESSLSFKEYFNSFTNNKKSLLDIIYGNSFCGGWGKHVESWEPKKNNNTFLVRFEDMIVSPLELVEELAKFLDIQTQGFEIPTFDELKKINPRFFRSGKTNSWEDRYSADEHVAFWLENYIQMIDYGYTNKMPEDFKNNTQLMRALSAQNTYLMNLINKEMTAKSKQIVELENRLKLQQANASGQEQALRKNVQELQHTNTELNNRIREKDSEIQHKTNQLHDKESNLLSLKSSLENKEEDIKQLNQLVGEKESLIKTKNGIIQNKLDILKVKDQKIKQATENLNYSQRLLKEKQSELNEIKRSKKYKLATNVAYPYLKLTGKL